MPDNTLKSIKVWNITLRRIAQLGKDVARQRGMPSGKSITHAEVVSIAVASMVATQAKGAGR